MRYHIFLVPGFFGFANIGGLTYFHHAHRILSAALAPLGGEVVITPVKTSPTASITRRTVRLAETIAQVAGEDGQEPIFIIGHSTGGLDARLLASPDTKLPTELRVKALRERVRAVVSVASPHQGTPMASFFNGVMGQKLLLLLTLLTIYSLRFGRAPLGVMTKLGALFTRLDDLVGLDNTILDQLYDNLLDEFTDERREEVQRFLQEVREDQSLIPQLTPEGIDLFNAGATDNPAVRYGCVVTQAHRPGLRSAISTGLSPYNQLTHALFRGLHWLSRGHKQRGALAEPWRVGLQAAYGEVPDGDSNDGVVPTLSQLHGELIRAVWSDHLDVVGHFDDPTHQPPHVDWLATGSHFDRRGLELVWGDIAHFLAETLER